MHLHVILCYCSAAQQQGCDSYSSSSGGSTVFSKSDFSSTVAVEHYRKTSKTAERKTNKQKQAQSHGKLWKMSASK